MKCPHCGRTIDDEAAFCPWCCNAIPGAPTYDSYEYEGFISYRHLPHEHKLATHLQRSLEGFSVPKALREEAGKKRLGKFFRDEDELPTARSLNEQIRDALKRSPILIVICTPQTRESEWVLREVELFASFHGREHICVALCAGEPSESFPPLLLSRTVVDADGTVREVDDEPIAADFRDGSRKQYRTELPRLAAALIGCGYDDLHQRLRARRQRLVLSLASVIAAVSLSFGSFAFWQRSQIKKNYRLAQINESEVRATQANELLEQGDRYQAVAVALSGLPTEGEDASRPFVPAAQMALERAMGLYPQPLYSQWSPEYSVLGLRSAGSDQDSTGTFVAFDLTGSIRVFDERGFDLATITVDAPRTTPDTEADSAGPYLKAINEQVAYVGFGYVACYDIETQEKLWSKELDDCQPTSPLAVNEEEGLLALTLEEHDTSTMRTLLIDATTGEVSKELTYERIAPRPDESYMEVSCATFSSDATQLAVGINGCAYVIDLASGEANAVKLAQDEAVDLAFCDDGLLALSEHLELGSTQLTEDMTVQCFGHTLDELWSFSQIEDLFYGFDGTTSDACAGFRFPIEPSEAQEGEGIVVLRNELYTFDTQTGVTTRHIKLDDPLLDCLAVDNYLYLVTNNGDVTLISMSEQESPLTADEHGHMQGDITRNLGAASKARFVLNSGCNLILWNDEPAKCRIYTFGTSGLITNRDFLFDSYDLGGVMQAAASEYSMYADGTIYLLDSTNLSAERTLELNDLPRLAGCDSPGLYRFANRDLYVYGPDQTADGSVVYAIPSDTSREPVELTFADMNLNTNDTRTLREYATGNDTVLLLHDSAHARAVSMATQQVTLDLSFTDRLNGCWFTTDALIANVGYVEAYNTVSEELLDQVVTNRIGGLARNDRRTTLQTYRYVDGTRLEAPWDDVSPWEGRNACIAINNACDRLAIACADGIVRLYDAKEYTLLWESAFFESGLQGVFVDDESGNVLIQDGMGYLALLSSTDGALLKASSLPVESIDSYCPLWGSDKLIAGFYQVTDLEGSRGLIIISTDPDAFGPQSEINQGLFCNLTGDLVAIETDDDVKICIRLNGSNLTDIAQTMADAHPLTNSERLLYGLEE